MARFMVEFKDLKRQVIIESQSDQVAKDWAERQLKAWGKESKVSVTPYLVEAEKTPEKPAEPAPAEKPAKRASRKPKNFSKKSALSP